MNSMLSLTRSEKTEWKCSTWKVVSPALAYLLIPMVKNTSLALFIKLRQRGTYSLVGNCRKLMRSLKVKDGQRYL